MQMTNDYVNSGRSPLWSGIPGLHWHKQNRHSEAAHADEETEPPPRMVKLIVEEGFVYKR